MEQQLWLGWLFQVRTSCHAGCESIDGNGQEEDIAKRQMVTLWLIVLTMASKQTRVKRLARVLRSRPNGGEWFLWVEAHVILEGHKRRALAASLSASGIVANIRHVAAAFCWSVV